MTTLKKRKGQWKTPTETSVQLQSFLNSDASWMRIPWNPERFKSVDSMRTTYVDAARYHNVKERVFVKAYGDSILLMKKTDKRDLSKALDDVLTGFKGQLMELIER